MTIIMVTCTVALVLACAAILVYEVADYRKVLRRNTEVMADVIGANSAAALSFKDKSAAGDTLAALKAEPYVISACVYDKSGEVFATFNRGDNATEAAKPPTVHDETYFFDQSSLNLFHKIRFDGEILGTVYIRSDLKVVSERLRTYLGII